MVVKFMGFEVIFKTSPSRKESSTHSGAGLFACAVSCAFVTSPHLVLKMLRILVPLPVIFASEFLRTAAKGAAERFQVPSFVLPRVCIRNKYTRFERRRAFHTAYRNYVARSLRISCTLSPALFETRIHCVLDFDCSQ